MDFDSIITFLFIIAFFILPGILKQLKAKKKKNIKPKKTKKKPSIFDRIGEKIQKFVRELEQQALKQKQADNKQGSDWDRFEEDEISSQDFETFDQEEDFGKPESGIPEAAIPEAQIPAYSAAVKEPEEGMVKQGIKESLSGKGAAMQHPGAAKYVFKSNPLQNAVIWSEILGKPVGLKN
ncbi:MAG: hypothetical protein PF690_14740 [Deltaproteobacteria bacterium]|nr:hypothetical protein [Deltaproteobacteria bacterium]